MNMMQQNGLYLIGFGYFIWVIGFLKRRFGFAALYSRLGKPQRAIKIRALYGRAALAIVYVGLLVFAAGGLGQ